ncbi:ATP-binding protein [Candidatus Pelagibacter sp.]|uniref:ATP-binding protein n=1 Tax=Candidatus Pelagibacter sp. TaxID=2024849 RepID=UPI003F851473
MILEIKSDPAELKNVRRSIENFCNENVSKIDVFLVKLAVDEALQNIIRYAYDFDKTRKIIIKLEKISENSLKAELRDFGTRVSSSEIKPRELHDVRPGGLGIHFIKNIAKKMSYEHQDDGGTLLTLVF